MLVLSRSSAAFLLLWRAASDAASPGESCAGESYAEGSPTEVRGRDHLLIQFSKPTVSLAASELIAGAARGTPSEERRPLCDPDIVEQTCRKLNAGKDWLSAELLARHLNANTSAMDSAWQALGHLADRSATCRAVCESVLHYVVREGGVLPPSTDIACYTVAGNTTCDVDVSPSKLVEEVASAQMQGHPDEGSPEVVDDGHDVTFRPPELVRYLASGEGSGALRRSVSNRKGSRKNVTQLEELIQYSEWNIVEYLANSFRIFPSRGVDEGKVSLLQASAAVGQRMNQQIAGYEAKAKAWLAVVLNEMDAYKTAGYRRTWFGGQGYSSDAQVRDRVLRTMNFAYRVLTNGVHYIFPAEQAAKSSCASGAAAYVWKYTTTQAEGYVENDGPVCRSVQEAYQTPCGTDSYGRYFIHLCQGWNQADEGFKVAALIHEATHHSGPSDITYDRPTMKAMSQENQMHNAANYEAFAADIAGAAYGSSSGGCSDTDANCALYKGYGYCANVENVRSSCRSTCGLC